jgi:creatinine amidohydrolase
MYIPEMTWIEIRDILPHIKVGIIPTGSTEQHGPHLPLQSDAAFCLYICKAAARKVYPIALVTTPVSIGISRHHMKFPGTLTLRPETFINTIYDLAWSLKQHGLEKVVIINGHGGNQAAMKLAARKIYDELGLTVASFSYWELLDDKKAKEILETYPARTFPGHACEFETSLSYVIQPELIRKDKIAKSDELILPVYESFFAKIEDEYATSGVCRGDPRCATLEKGEKLIEAIVHQIAVFLKQFGEHGDNL